MYAYLTHSVSLLATLHQGAATAFVAPACAALLLLLHSHHGAARLRFAVTITGIELLLQQSVLLHSVEVLLLLLIMMQFK